MTGVEFSTGVNDFDENNIINVVHRIGAICIESRFVSLLGDSDVVSSNISEVRNVLIQLLGILWICCK